MKVIDRATIRKAWLSQHHYIRTQPAIALLINEASRELGIKINDDEIQ
jgi:hypothetical protein